MKNLSFLSFWETVEKQNEITVQLSPPILLINVDAKDLAKEMHSGIQGTEFLFNVQEAFEKLHLQEIILFVGFCCDIRNQHHQRDQSSVFELEFTTPRSLSRSCWAVITHLTLKTSSAG